MRNGLECLFVSSLQDALVLLVVGGLLYYGASWQMFDPGTDPARYQCYAMAFWQGWSAIQQLPLWQCTFIVSPANELVFISQHEILQMMQQWGVPSTLIHVVAHQLPNMPYHTLPYEYPWPTLLPFSLGLVAPAYWYHVAFALWMLIFAGGIYVVLERKRSRRAALAYALYLVVGGWWTVVARFDIIPAGLTLLAVMCAEHKRWNWAFALLAWATLCKFYPATLLVPFLLALQQGMQGKWYAWRRWQPIGVFVGICVLVISISLLLSVRGTLAPLEYFGNRPVQVESLAASILWVLSFLGKTSLAYVSTFGSLNVVSPLSWSVTCVMLLLSMVGLLSTWWLHWRERIDLAMACLLTLLVVMATGKVFSPQYLIWVIPLAAYVGQGKRWWLLFWTLLGFLTSWIFPYLYDLTPHILQVPSIPLFYPVTALRNFLLLGFILFMLAFSMRSVRKCQSGKKVCGKER